MLSSFNLKPGVDVKQFCDRYDDFVAHMIDAKMIVGSGPVGRRDRASPLDTDREHPQSFMAVMDFRDKAQAEAAYAMMTSPPKVTIRLHYQMWSLATDLVFVAWEDVDDTEGTA